MWLNQIFSLIVPVPDDEGTIDTIQNIIVCEGYELANQLARSVYGDTAYAIETTLYPLSIGCTYVDGKFYDIDGVEIPRSPTTEEQINLLKDHQVNAELETDYRLCMLELGLA